MFYPDGYEDELEDPDFMDMMEDFMGMGHGMGHVNHFVFIEKSNKL
jgi:hypothetical protein